MSGHVINGVMTDLVTTHTHAADRGDRAVRRCDGVEVLVAVGWALSQVYMHDA
jgi:hypothetical protein